jgi:hypothetical protein
MNGEKPRALDAPNRDPAGHDISFPEVIASVTEQPSTPTDYRRHRED